MPFKWLQHDSKSTRLYYCRVTILGSAPPPTDTMMSVFLLPTLNGGKKKNGFHHQWFEKKLQPPNMQRVSLLFWEGVGDFVWGKNTSWITDVSGLMSGTVGTGQLYGDCAWKPCRRGLPLASRIPLVYSKCWLAKVTLPLSWEPLWMSPNSTR